MRRLIFPLLIAHITTGILTASDWWEKKPYMEWSAKDVDQMLNDSPWTALTTYAIPKASPVSSYPINWRILLLSAKPVCEAYLRRLSFPQDILEKPGFEKSVSVDQAAKTREEEHQARLQGFIASNPGDIRVRGDNQLMVIAIAFTQFVPPPVSNAGGYVRRGPNIVWATHLNWQSWQEEPRPDLLMELRLSDWEGYTFLSTETGKRVTVIRYDRPGLDMLGAKLYFPRKLANGTPLVTPGDRELRFETRINGKVVKVKFDLRKMIYKGKLET